MAPLLHRAAVIRYFHPVSLYISGTAETGHGCHARLTRREVRCNRRTVSISNSLQSQGTPSDKSRVDKLVMSIVHPSPPRGDAPGVIYIG